MCLSVRNGTAGSPPTANTHDRKVTVRVANAYQSAVAAYRVTLVGAAATSAGGRQALFDSIQVSAGRQANGDLIQALRLGDTDTGGKATCPNPVQYEAVKTACGESRRVKNPTGGVRNRTAQPGLGT